MAILSLQNVGYKVDTSEILKNINIDINENEFITITGPSGGGKSTLLKRSGGGYGEPILLDLFIKSVDSFSFI